MQNTTIGKLSRRQFMLATASASLLSLNVKPAVANTLASSAQPLPAAQTQIPELSGTEIYLTIAEQTVNFTGKTRTATTVNGSFPAPTLRLKQGDTVKIHVTNHLNVDTSIHWHGILLPYQMDGIPGISFAGIKPNQTFTYEFTLTQHGTYWYHSHSGFQEQTGLIGAMIIEPADSNERIKADCEHVVVLSDWTDLDPLKLLAKLKKNSGFDNVHKPTVVEFYQDINRYGWAQAWQMRKHWQQMRMSPTDFSDLSARSLTYLINGQPCNRHWTGLFKAGETVLLRVINASAATIFDVQIPHLELSVVAADGQAIKPVCVDEFRIGGGETYDILVSPKTDAYTIFAQSIDRSGYVSGTLATHRGLTAPIPPMDAIEKLTMTDMMGAMGVMDSNSSTSHQHQHQHNMQSLTHPLTEQNNPFVDMQVLMPRTNLDDAGVNLRHHKRRVLTYADLYSLKPLDTPAPTRTIPIHLTGNMHRYVWGINGLTDSEALPLRLYANERVRLQFINDTMMTHPMHLHGMFSDLMDEDGQFKARKHTVMVQPAQQICVDVTAVAGMWALHCHLFYHMTNGMFRTVEVI